MATPPVEFVPAVLHASAVLVDTDASVTLSGEVDLYTAPGLRAALRVLIDDGATDFRIDVQDLAYIDSTGLHVLLELATATRDLGGSVTVVGAGAMLRRIVEVTGVDAMLTLA